MKFSRRCI